MPELLRIEDLSVAYHERNRTVRAVDAVNLELEAGRTLAVVGESGCGKTTLALSLLDLVPSPGRIDSGRVLLRGPRRANDARTKSCGRRAGAASR